LTYLKPFLADFGHRDIDSLKILELAKWLSGRGGAPDTKFNRVRILHYVFNWCEEFLHTSNPAIAIPLPKIPERRPKAILPKTIDALFKACTNERDRFLIAILTDLGLRAGSIIALTLGDFDFEKHLISINNDKGGRSRTVPLTPLTERYLIAWLKVRPGGRDCDPNLPVFCNLKNGKPLTYWGLNEIMQRLAVCAGVEKEIHNLHSFRHYYAIASLLHGQSLALVAQVLGDSIQVVMTYYARFTGVDLFEKQIEHSPFHSVPCFRELAAS